MGQVNAYSTVVIKTCKVHGKRWRCCLLFMVIFSNRSIWFFIVGLFFGHRSLVLSYNTVVISWRPFFWSERWSFLHRSRVVMHRLLLSSATYYQSLLPYTYLLPSTLRLLPYILPTYYHPMVRLRPYTSNLPTAPSIGNKYFYDSFSCCSNLYEDDSTSSNFYHYSIDIATWSRL